MMLLQSLLPLTPLPTEALVETCQLPPEVDCSTRTANNKDIAARCHRLAAIHLPVTTNAIDTGTTTRLSEI